MCQAHWITSVIYYPYPRAIYYQPKKLTYTLRKKQKQKQKKPLKIIPVTLKASSNLCFGKVHYDLGQCFKGTRLWQGLGGRSVI